MFTDGLDHNALQWIRKEEKGASNLSSPTGEANVNVGRDHGSLSGRHVRSNSKFGLPPSQLANGHMHSGLLRTQQPSNLHTANTSDDWEESVGSISGCNDDSYDTDVSEDSEETTSSDSPRRNVQKTTSTVYGGRHGERDDAVDLRKVENTFSATPPKKLDNFVDRYFSMPKPDRHIPSIHQEQVKGTYDHLEGSGAEHGGFYSEYEQQETQSATPSFDVLRQPETETPSFDVLHQHEVATATVGTSEAGGGQTESTRDYLQEGNRRLSQSAGDRYPWLDPQTVRGGEYFDNDFHEGGIDKLGPRSTQQSSDVEASDEETTDHVLQEQAARTQTKHSNYPSIAVDQLRCPKDFNRRESLGVPGVVQRLLDEEKQEGSSKEGSPHSRPWASDSNLKFQTPDTSQDLRRSQSDSIGLPPSAPPMLASMSVEASSEVNTSMPANLVSKSTSFSRQREREPSGSVRQDEQPARSVSGVAAEESFVSTKQSTYSLSHPPPTYISGQAAWQALIAYDACVRLCLGAWARGCPEAPEFLQDECTLLRECFGLQQLLLQPYEEMKRKGVSDDTEATAASKPKRNVGKLKVQVCKFKMSKSKLPTGCTCPSLRSIKFVSLFASVDERSANIRAPLLTGWATVRKLRFVQPILARGNASQRSLAYVNAGAQYMRQVSGILKDKVNSLRSNALEGPQEGMFCLLKLKSSTEKEAVRMQPGSGDTTVFILESPSDELLVDVQDIKGALQGRCVIPLSSMNDDPADRVRWFPIYMEPEHEVIGKVQLSISYAPSGEFGDAKWGVVGETLAYDIVLEVAMRAQRFQRRNLRLQGSWSWLLSQFASYYGVSEAYTKLRYLASVMEVATPTEDCLVLIYDLLCPIVKTRDEGSLDRQEKRILAEVEDQVSQLLTLVFENYKSLDETSSSGMSEMFPAVGAAAPALVPAVQIYTLLHDILTLDAQITLRNFFKTAAKKRCKRHMSETDEFVSSTSDGFLMDPLTLGTAYQKMKTLCMNISNEVRTDIDIHNQHVLPSSIDLPNIVAGIYNVELCDRLRSFLVACPPPSPTPPVAELMIATADFQQDLVSWGIRPSKGGVDATELFHLYIVLWIQDKKLQLLDFCKLDKDRYMWVTTQNVTVPFVEEMYERIRDTLNEYEVIINRWPEYTIPLEIAIADVERTIISAIEKQYSDVLTPLKDVMIPKKFSIQYMQKLTRRRSISLYSVPSQLGVMLNSMKRLLDTLRPKVEQHMKGWVACLPTEGGGVGKAAFGEHFNEVTIEVRAKYKNYLHAIVEKLADNARLQRSTKLKKILQDTREAGGESDIRERMQPLSNQLIETISHLHEVFASRVFVAVCRGYWDRMARDVLHFLENRKENRSWYKGSSVALGILDDIFASQMQRLQGHSLQEKDLDPPRSVMEARTMLSKDVPNGVDSSALFFY
ncbi:unnamed protein product [Calypogeia fissa]